MSLKQELETFINEELIEAMHNHYEHANMIEEHTGRHDTRARGTAEGYAAIGNRLKEIINNHPE